MSSHEHSERMEHTGVVKQVSFNSIVVSVEEPCQCEGCSIAIVCNGGQEKSRDEIVIPRPRGEARDAFSPGDRVKLEATSGSQLRATLFTFVIPTIIILAAVLLLLAYAPGLGKPLTVLAAIGAVAVYELILYLFRKDLAMAVTWQIRHC